MLSSWRNAHFRILGHLGANLGPSWGILGYLGPSGGCLGAILGRVRTELEPSSSRPAPRRTKFEPSSSRPRPNQPATAAAATAQNRLEPNSNRVRTGLEPSSNRVRTGFEPSSNRVRTGFEPGAPRPLGAQMDQKPIVFFAILYIFALGRLHGLIKLLLRPRMAPRRPKMIPR